MAKKYTDFEVSDKDSAERGNPAKLTDENKISDKSANTKQHIRERRMMWRELRQQTARNVIVRVMV